ncbi:MAG: O-antigen ligase family protein [Myxococcota bacterium]|nr:O-antigen ligase family protein [Myxococcota bacterium]
MLVAVALATQVFSRRGMPQWSPLLVMLGIAAALTALQLIPMPGVVVEAFDPVGAALRADGANAAGVDPWVSLSRDPSSTLRALALFVILLGAAVVALRAAASEQGRYFCLAGVGAVCGAAALVVAVHEMLRATTLYGLYAPVHATPPVLGPLLNSNHLGGLMALGATVSLGLLMYTRQAARTRALWALNGAACVTCALATLSRGAVLALIGGVTIAVAVLVVQRFDAARSDKRHRSRRQKFLSTTLPAGVVAISCLIVVVYTSIGNVSQQLGETSLQEIDDPYNKYAAWRSSVALIEETPWLGIGRGAFEPSFTRVHPASAFVTFSHLENEYLQALVEWGVIGVLLLGAAGVWLVVTAVRRWREGPLAAGALGALASVAIQSNVDFGMELLGLAVPVVFVAATLASRQLRELSSTELLRARVLRVGHLAALGLAVLALVLPITRSVNEDHVTLRAAPSRSQILAAIERHPLDYFAYAVAAQDRLDHQDPAGVRLLNHSLVLHPTHPGLHLIAARLLLAKHPRQAAAEYTAALRGTRDPRAIVRELVTVFPAAQVAQAIPVDYENVSTILKALEQLGREDVQVAWLAGVLDFRPTAAIAQHLYAVAMRRNDDAIAERAGRHWVAQLPGPESKLALGKLLAKRKMHAEVVETLAEVSTWQGRIAEIAEAWILLCDARIALAEWDDAAHCLRSLERAGVLEGPNQGHTRTRLEAVKNARNASEAGLAPAPVGIPAIEPAR